jgi:hypothetical protein
MLEAAAAAGTMVEVLMHDDLPLSNSTIVVSFSADDKAIVDRVLSELSVPWGSRLEQPQGRYPRSANSVRQVEEFIRRALAEPSWRGNGLEFDYFGR